MEGNNNNNSNNIKDIKWYTYSFFFGHNKQINNRGIAFSHGDKRWKRTRTAALELLSPQKVDDFIELIIFEADSLTKELINKTKQHGQLYPLTYIQASTLNVILTTTFGTRVNSIDDPLLKEIIHNFELHMYLGGFTYDFSSYLPFLKFLDVIFRKEHTIKKFIDTSFHPLIKRLADQASKNNKDCFYTRLLKMKDEYELVDEDILATVCKYY